MRQEVKERAKNVLNLIYKNGNQSDIFGDDLSDIIYLLKTINESNKKRYKTIEKQLSDNNKSIWNNIKLYIINNKFTIEELQTRIFNI